VKGKTKLEVWMGDGFNADRRDVHTLYALLLNNLVDHDPYDAE
jgi:hypothetical protein